MACGFDDKKCAICYCADGGCVASMSDDYFFPATPTQLIYRLNDGRFKDYRNLMITTLLKRFGINYYNHEEVAHSLFVSNKKSEQKLCCEERTKNYERTRNT